MLFIDSSSFTYFAHIYVYEGALWGVMKEEKSHDPLSRALPHAVVRRRRLPPDTRRGRRLAERLLSGDGGLVCPHLPTNRAYIALPLAHTMAMHAWPHDTCHGLHAWPGHMLEHALGEHATWAPVMPCHGHACMPWPI